MKTWPAGPSQGPGSPIALWGRSTDGGGAGGKGEGGEGGTEGRGPDLGSLDMKGGTRYKVQEGTRKGQQVPRRKGVGS